MRVIIFVICKETRIEPTHLCSVFSFIVLVQEFDVTFHDLIRVDTFTVSGVSTRTSRLRGWEGKGSPQLGLKVADLIFEGLNSGFLLLEVICVNKMLWQG